MTSSGKQTFTLEKYDIMSTSHGLLISLVETKLHICNNMCTNIFVMALVEGRYEGLFTRRSHISQGRSPSEI
jgi:hypothetical protein